MHALSSFSIDPFYRNPCRSTPSPIAPFPSATIPMDGNGARRRWGAVGCAYLEFSSAAVRRIVSKSKLEFSSGAVRRIMLKSILEFSSATARARPPASPWREQQWPILATWEGQLRMVLVYFFLLAVPHISRGPDRFWCISEAFSDHMELSRQAKMHPGAPGEALEPRYGQKNRARPPASPWG